MYGVRGEGIKIAVIDTGIDYTHANFGGPGTVAAYNAAHATERAPADPALFGPNAPKVKGGTDLVGDDYDADRPDDQPCRCPIRIRSTATDTAATWPARRPASACSPNGSTYTGPYDASTTSSNLFTSAPASRRRPTSTRVRVFGCDGLDRCRRRRHRLGGRQRHGRHQHVARRRLRPGDDGRCDGGGRRDGAGVVVVSSAGNAGDINYVLGSPGPATKGIAVAAGAKELNDRTAIFALPATPAGAAAKNITAINANNANWTSPSNLGVVVLRAADGTVSLGCDPAEYVAAGVAGKIVVTQRGVCARVARAIFGQKAGAAAVVMINNAAVLPPFEGPITSNPDTGEQYNVTIPLFGVKGLAATSTSDGFALTLRNGMTITLTEGTPILPVLGSFTSTGPRTPDARLKPDVTAPGVAVISTLVGSGNQAETLSGTSMATPHIAGVAALVLQAHPKWKPAAVKSAIMNSGDPVGIADYSARRGGTGMVSAAGAVGSLAYAYADKDETSASFGFDEITTDWTRTKTVTVHNDATTAATFNVSVTSKGGSPHNVTFSASQITVPARGNATVDFTLTVPVATAGNSDAFRDVAGLITFTPSTSASNRGYGLKVAYYLVPRVSSNVDAALAIPKKSTTGLAAVTNQGSPIAATADFYAWGLTDGNELLDHADVRAVGVQTFPSDGVLAFAVNVNQAWQTPFADEFDIDVDTNNDGTADFVVFNGDLGRLQTGTRNGQHVVVVQNLATLQATVQFLVSASTDSSTMIMPVNFSQLGLTSANPRFTYAITAFDLFNDDIDTVPDTATFNAFTPAISTGQFATVAPNATASVPVAIDPVESKITPPIGYMIVTPDNKNGAKEAKLIKMKF